MARFLKVVAFFCLVAFTAAQQQQDAGTNYNAGDSGRSETVGPDGEVRGQYQYTDPNGKLITVKYTAGKNGFQVEGDHLPQAPQAPQAQQQQPAPYNPHPQQYNSQPQQSLFNNFPQQQQQQQPQQQQVPYFNQVPQNNNNNNFFQQQQPQFGSQPQYQQQQPQNFGFQQQQQQPQIPQLPQLAPQQHNSINGNGFNPFNFGQQAPQQAPQQQYYNPQQQQYNGNNNNGNRPTKVSVSQQPGAGFTYNIES